MNGVGGLWLELAFGGSCVEEGQWSSVADVSSLLCVVSYGALGNWLAQASLHEDFCSRLSVSERDRLIVGLTFSHWALHGACPESILPGITALV